MPQNYTGDGQALSPDFFEKAENVSAAWIQNAARLAIWTEHIIVQGDAFGQYLPMNKRTKDKKAYTKHKPLTRKIVERHFVGRDVGHLIGVHSTIRDKDGCWSVMQVGDIDRHTESVDPAITLNAALTWYERSRGLGFSPLLIDSNGYGGYHLYNIFDDWVATPLFSSSGNGCSVAGKNWV
jgi:hypothetical protein